MSGRTNASVFPVPVCAVATTLRPASAGSIACACTGVGSVKPNLLRLLFSCADRVSSEKLFIYKLCGRLNQRADYRIRSEGFADCLQLLLYCTALPDYL